jgi:hypothetical protein
LATVDSDARIEPVDAEVVEDDFTAAEEEAVDGVPVLEDDPDLTPEIRSARQVSGPLPAASPAVQAAAAAATGFVAGAATLAIARRRTARRLARTTVRRRAADALPILGTRSFLIDIHLLRPNE